MRSVTAPIRRALAAGLCGLALTVGLLWWSERPLGVAGEWTWPRIPFSGETAWGWLLAALAAAVYIALSAVGGRRFAVGSPARRAAWISVLAVAAFAWLIVVQSAVPGIAGLSKTPFVLYYPRSSGYFWQARYEVRDTRSFLAGYEELLAERDYLHIGTHPPGLTLLFRALLGLLNGSPRLTGAILATEPAAVREAAEAIRANAAVSGREFQAVDEASLWLAALLAHAAAAATVVPLYLLLAMLVERPLAWYAAACWPLVPAVAVFLPKSDAAYPLLSILGPYLWLSGWKSRSLMRCGLAGLTLLAGMLFSLAFAPVAAITGLATLLGETRWRPAERQPARWSWSLKSLAAAAAAFFLPCLGLWWAYDLNLPRVWLWNAANHALFYEHHARTWWKWLLVSPVEIAVAAGGPLACLAAIGMASARQTPARTLIVPLVVVWGALWLSGKNLGEAARLWLLLMPWLTIPAAHAIDAALRRPLPANGRLFLGGIVRRLCRAARRTPGSPGACTENELGPLDHALTPCAASGLAAAWLVLLVLQAAASILTVTRIDGFHFEQL